MIRLWNFSTLNVLDTATDEKNNMKRAESISEQISIECQKKTEITLVPVIFDLTLVCHPLSQSDAKLNPTADWKSAFSRARKSLLTIILRSV